MRVAATSVQEAVRRIVSSNRSVYDCLRMGLVNYTALAARIRPEVERLAGGQVNPNTIVVAVKRYADALGGGDAGGGQAPRSADTLRGARISLTDGVMDMRFDAVGLGAAGGAAGLIERISRVTSDFDLFRLPGSLRLVVEDMEGARSAVQTVSGAGAIHTGLVRIKITVPGGAASDAGALVVDLLRRNGIGYVDAYLGGEGMVVTLDEGDAPRAYDALRAEMSGGGP